MALLGNVLEKGAFVKLITILTAAREPDFATWCAERDWLSCALVGPFVQSVKESSRFHT